MLVRTPILGLVIAAFMSILVMLIFEVPARPFSTGDAVLIYLVSFLPSLGIAMLFDPYSKAKKEEYLKINFYAEPDDQSGTV